MGLPAVDCAIFIFVCMYLSLIISFLLSIFSTPFTCIFIPLVGIRIGLVAAHDTTPEVLIPPVLLSLFSALLLLILGIRVGSCLSIISFHYFHLRSFFDCGLLFLLIGLHAAGLSLFLSSFLSCLR